MGIFYWLGPKLFLIPIALLVWALLDLVRMGRSRWWIVLILLPILGPIAYLILSRAPGAAALHVDVTQREIARRQLAQLEAQLASWRGPAVLADAGEQLLILNRPAEAETRLREARAAGAEMGDVNYPLARALAQLRRPAEAVPLLDELLAKDPDHAIGEARTLLAVCLDEAGDAARAEKELRKALERRSPPSTKLRLARLLVRRGARDEGAELAREFRQEAAALRPAMRRALGPWIPVARKLEAGKDAALPTVTSVTVARKRFALWAGAVLGIVAIVTGLAGFQLIRRMDELPEQVQRAIDEADAQESLREEIASLDVPPPAGAGDPATWDVPPVEVDKYVRVRKAMMGPLAALRRARASASDDEDPDEHASVQTTAALRALRDTLRQASAGSREIEALVGIVEWRFLRRNDAMGLGLPPSARSDWERAHAEANRPLPATGGDQRMQEWARRAAQARDLARQRLASLEAQAATEVTLSPATTTLLESRRAELEATPAVDLPDLLAVLGSRPGSEY